MQKQRHVEDMEQYAAYDDKQYSRKERSYGNLATLKKMIAEIIIDPE